MGNITDHTKNVKSDRKLSDS